MKKLFLLSFLFSSVLNAQTFPLCFNPLTSTSSPSVGTNPVSTISADFNNDGKADIVAVNYTSNNISILLGTGTGTFSAPVNYTVGAGPVTAATADFNNDSKIDLVVTNSNDATFSILLGLGNGTFSTAVNYSNPPNNKSITSSDFNNDGKADIATANISSNNISVFFGTGLGTFGAMTNYSVGANACSITNADFNNDGNSDLAIANRNSNNISVLLGSPSGTFAVAVNYSVGTGPTHITSADFNNDGKMDLVTTNFNTNNVSILLGAGNGTFVLFGNYAVLSTPFSLSCADFNGDGFLDLATANGGSNTISILLGVGTGSFVSANNYNVGTFPQGITKGDFNNDGKIDLTTANTTSNNLTILINGIIPTVSIIGVNSICNGSNSVITATGTSNSYNWSTGATLASITINPTTTSSYTVMGTSVLGCTNIAVKTITVNPLPIITVNSGAICSGNSFTMTPSGAATYSFSSGTAVVNPLSNSSFTVSGTSTAGCIGIAAISDVTVNPLPTIMVNSGSICTGSSFTIIPSGANTYTYSSGSNIVSPTSNMSYSITGTSTYGCMGSEVISSVTVNPLPTITVNSGTICSGSSFTMMPNGGVTYTYSSGVAVVSPTINTTNSVIGTDVNGCVNSATQTVVVNALPSISATTSSSVICSGESVFLAANGAVSYVWMPGNLTGYLVNESPLNTTTYTIIGTDVNGCDNFVTLIQNVNSCAGLNSLITNDKQVVIYPNPSNGIYTIELPSKSMIIITDAMGNEIYNQELIEGNYTIDINQYANGLYVLKTISNSIIQYTKLIKE